ncbi:SH3 domain-containing protein [Sinorhizobium alkalisoli]|uniref:Peptide-binding protein n=1 Tax=Sinorhizobium alkalisoli TaxID=1752398 RepID=A0A1E3V633_9HYPH|nr:SH3 domain-containing protein [Sinorhizobium alkalisoli]ODR89093.1 peptide-binding protein [Sinorhizobium alkalisoli]
MKHPFLRAAALGALLFMPAIAEAAGGIATANVNMRSGPSTRYPAVTVIPAGNSLEIHGCLGDRPWCDVSFYGGRGWVAGRYVQAVYRSNRVHVEPEYYRPLGIPTIVFEFDRYWDRNYRGREFYRDRDRWRRDRADDGHRRDWERREARPDWDRDRRRGDDEWESRADEDFFENRRREREQSRYEIRRESEMRTVRECEIDDFACEID